MISAIVIIKADVDRIPERNIARMQALTAEERAKLSPHLFG